MSSQDKVSEKVQAAIFAQLLNNAANGECADCHTRSPNWVSLDFGVFICIRCSGVHRQIGPHITRVRSVKLDGWTKDNIEIMATVGNKIANDYYEHKMPTGFRKPGANSSPEECRRFVDEKYIRKAFVPANFAEPVKDFVACRTKGTKPDFSYSQQQQQTQEKEVAPLVVKTEQQSHHAVKSMRKKSTSIDKLPPSASEKKVIHQNHHADLLSPDVDLLGNFEAHHHKHDAHSAPPRPSNKINFASFKKAQNQPEPQPSQPQPSQPQQDNLTEELAWSLEGSQPNNNSGTSQPQSQPQENKVDLMKLYNQPQVHQNHFMNGMQQGWQYGNGWNNGMYQGYNGAPMGHVNNFNVGFQPNYGGQQFNNTQNMTQQVPMQNQFYNNGFVQATPNQFF